MWFARDMGILRFVIMLLLPAQVAKQCSRYAALTDVIAALKDIANIVNGSIYGRLPVLAGTPSMRNSATCGNHDDGANSAVASDN